MGSLDNLSFCITGDVETFKNRVEVQEYIKNHGGLVRSGVSKNLSYLVTNSDEPTAKYSKAKELGIRIISEAQLRVIAEK